MNGKIVKTFQQKTKQITKVRSNLYQLKSSKDPQHIIMLNLPLLKYSMNETNFPINLKSATRHNKFFISNIDPTLSPCIKSSLKILQKYLEKRGLVKSQSKKPKQQVSYDKRTKLAKIYDLSAESISSISSFHSTHLDKKFKSLTKEKKKKNQKRKNVDLTITGQYFGNKSIQLEKSQQPTQLNEHRSRLSFLNKQNQEVNITKYKILENFNKIFNSKNQVSKFLSLQNRTKYNSESKDHAKYIKRKKSAKNSLQKIEYSPWQNGEIQQELSIPIIK